MRKILFIILFFILVICLIPLGSNADPPSAPSNLRINAVEVDWIHLAWDDNAVDETGFRIERSTDGVNFTQIATTATGETSYSDAGVTFVDAVTNQYSRINYYYRARAFNNDGNSVFSNTASVVNSTMVIANWDVVPYQVIDSTFKTGVIAFHEAGVDVEFYVNGSSVGIVTAPTYNDRTGVYEYWIELNAANYPDGQLNLIFTARPDNSNHIPRSKDLILYGNAGGTLLGYNPASEKWVDCVNGDDSAGDGTEGNPYATIARAFTTVGAGGTVYLQAGIYDLTNTIACPGYSYWTTVRPAPGLTKNDVKIRRPDTSAFRFNKRMVTWKDVEFYSDIIPDPEVEGYATLFTLRSFEKLWFDDVQIKDYLRNTMPTLNDQGGEYYMTGCIMKDLSSGLGTFQRNCTFVNIGNDVWRARDNQVLVNIHVDNMEPDVGAHADLIQWYNPGTIIENVILYNIKANNMNSQGLFGGEGRDTAVVNFLAEEIIPGNHIMHMGYFQHTLMWHCTVANIGITLEDPTSHVYWGIQNNIFDLLISNVSDGNPVPTTLSGSTITHNHYNELAWNQPEGMGGEGSYTLGEPLYIKPGIMVDAWSASSAGYSIGDQAGKVYGIGNYVAIADSDYINVGSPDYVSPTDAEPGVGVLWEDYWVWGIAGVYELNRPYDYHLRADSLAYQAGVPLECVPADMNGDLYNSSTPSLGAYSASGTNFIAPTDLAAQSVSSSQVDLTWTNSLNTTELRIERALNIECTIDEEQGIVENVPGAFVEIGRVLAGISSYGDTTVSAGTTYYYRVRAYSGMFKSSHSNISEITIEGEVPSGVIYLLLLGFGG